MMDRYRLAGPRPSLVQRVAAAVIGGVLLVALFFVGLFAWVLIAGFALIAGVALTIWLWRQKRRLAKFRAAHEEALRRQAGGQTRPTEQVIEGEFVVMTERKRRGDS